MYVSAIWRLLVSLSLKELQKVSGNCLNLNYSLIGSVYVSNKQKEVQGRLWIWAYSRCNQWRQNHFELDGVSLFVFQHLIWSLKSQKNAREVIWGRCSSQLGTANQGRTQVINRPMKVWDYQIIFLSGPAWESYTGICKTAAVLQGLVRADGDLLPVQHSWLGCGCRGKDFGKRFQHFTWGFALLKTLPFPHLFSQNLPVPL